MLAHLNPIPNKFIKLIKIFEKNIGISIHITEKDKGVVAKKVLMTQILPLKEKFLIRQQSKTP